MNELWTKLRMRTIILDQTTNQTGLGLSTESHVDLPEDMEVDDALDDPEESV